MVSQFCGKLTPRALILSARWIPVWSHAQRVRPVKHSESLQRSAFPFSDTPTALLCCTQRLSLCWTTHNMSSLNSQFPHETLKTKQNKNIFHCILLNSNYKPVAVVTPFEQIRDENKFLCIWLIHESSSITQSCCLSSTPPSGMSLSRLRNVSIM